MSSTKKKTQHFDPIFSSPEADAAAVVVEVAAAAAGPEAAAVAVEVAAAVEAVEAAVVAAGVEAAAGVEVFGSTGAAAAAWPVQDAQ
jgi:hypothetical protein